MEPYDCQSGRGQEDPDSRVPLWLHSILIPRDLTSLGYHCTGTRAKTPRSSILESGKGIRGMHQRRRSRISLAEHSLVVPTGIVLEWHLVLVLTSPSRSNTHKLADNVSHVEKLGYHLPVCSRSNQYDCPCILLRKPPKLAVWSRGASVASCRSFVFGDDPPGVFYEHKVMQEEGKSGRSKRD